MKKIIVESLISSQKIAILENDKLIELLIENSNNEKTVSNIYRGIVKKVLPGIQACFIDIGFEKLAYLQLNKDNTIKNGDEIIVQVKKEQIGDKGAKLTTEISLAGRYLVYIPSNNRITLSNKIQVEKERFRLKNILKKLSKDGDGFIIRTEAVGCSREELEKDVEELASKYETILKENKLGMGTKLLYKDLDATSKYIKDNINENVELIVLNDENKYEEIKTIVKNIDKQYIQKIKLEKNEDVFDIYKVENQIEKMLDKKVWLKSGGYLIIEKTEALTVIDVNTGKFTGNLKLEDTVFKTNIEASKEIAKQLKLRDIGGIVIVDFIDLKKQKDKDELLKVLNEELDKDKRKTEVLGMTKLGLVELVRRRDKEPITNYYIDTCKSCEGYATSKSSMYYIDQIEKEVIRTIKHTAHKSITFEIDINLYEDINKNHKDIINKIVDKYNINLKIIPNNKINSQKININSNS